MDKGKQRMNKPLVEKRRRARINNSLADLKKLLLAIPQESGMDGHRNKWEKADILEMAVFHFRRLQGINKGASKNPRSGPFKQGFCACMREVIRYMDDTEHKSPQVSYRILDHLQDRMEDLGVTNQPQKCLEALRDQEEDTLREDIVSKPNFVWRPWNQ